MDFALPQLDTKARANEGVQVPFKTLTGEPLLNAKKEPVGVVIMGHDSDEYRRLNRAIGRARIERMQKKRAEASSDEMLDLAEREDIELLAKITRGWFGVLDSKGREIEYSTENVIELYTKFPAAREQAEVAVTDRSRFIQPS